MRLVISILAVVSLVASDDYYGPPPSPPSHTPAYSNQAHRVPIKYQEVEKPIHENQHQAVQSYQMPQQNQQEKYIIMYQNEQQSQPNQNYDSHDINNMYTHVAEYIKNNKNEVNNDYVQNVAPVNYHNIEYAQTQVDNKNGVVNNDYVQNVAPVNHIEYAQTQVEYKAKTPKILDHQYQSNGHAYEYRYHTENGIQAHEVGEIGKSSTVKGAYSYVGDDGKSYTVTYIADEHGFRPQGDHLPTPPPIPAEIALALEKNARDEANGIIDDGQYHHHHPQVDQGHQQPTQDHQEYTIVDQDGYYH